VPKKIIYIYIYIKIEIPILYSHVNTFSITLFSHVLLVRYPQDIAIIYKRTSQLM